MFYGLSKITLSSTQISQLAEVRQVQPREKMLTAVKQDGQLGVFFLFVSLLKTLNISSLKDKLEQQPCRMSGSHFYG